MYVCVLYVWVAELVQKGAKRKKRVSPVFGQHFAICQRPQMELCQLIEFDVDLTWIYALMQFGRSGTGEIIKFPRKIVFLFRLEGQSFLHIE